MANRHLFPSESTTVKPVKKLEKPTKGKRQPKTATEPVVEAANEPVQESPKAKSAKEGKKVKVTGAIKPKKSSMMAAALQVLASAKEPMSCTDLIETMSTKSLWTSPGGKTPANTLYSSFLRLIQTKGKQAPIRKAGKGVFEISATA